MEIFIPMVSIFLFGGMGLLLLKAGRSKLKIQNEQREDGISTSIHCLVGMFQILVGGVGILIAINQIMVLMVAAIQFLFSVV